MDKENNENWLSLASIWFGCIASLPALIIGSTLIVSLTLTQTIFAAFVGYSFVSIFLSLLSVKSVKHRLNAVQLSERSFGFTGSKIIVGLIIGIASMAWFGIQTNIAGLAFSKILAVFNISFSVNISSLLWGIIMALTAVFGFKYIKWLNFIAVPSIIILVIFSLMVALKGVSLNDILAYEPTEKMPILKAIGMVIGVIAVGGVISPDYNRYAKTPKTAVIGSVVGLLPAAVAFLTIGAVLSIIKSSHNIVDIFAQIGYPIITMSILILVTWTSNVMSAYSGGLGLNSTFHLSKKHRPITTLFVGFIGTVLGMFGILAKFTDVIIILSAMIPPIAGVIISDYYLGSQNEVEKSTSFNWAGVIAWLFGVSIVFLIKSETKNLLGIVVSGIVYWFLELLNKKLLST